MHMKYLELAPTQTSVTTKKGAGCSEYAVSVLQPITSSPVLRLAILVQLSYSPAEYSFSARFSTYFPSPSFKFSVDLDLCGFHIISHSPGTFFASP